MPDYDLTAGALGLQSAGVVGAVVGLGAGYWIANGMLVIEAARQVEFSQQTQTIVLRGLVRPEDISQQNQVLSTAISSLELQVRGKGIITDYTHRPNLLVRLLQKALIF